MRREFRFGRGVREVVADVSEEGAPGGEFFYRFQRSFDGGVRGMRMMTQRVEESGKAAARLTNGMRVIVMLDDGSERETHTRSDPWQLGHGEWVVKLDGIAGGYSTMRVRPA